MIRLCAWERVIGALAIIRPALPDPVLRNIDVRLVYLKIEQNTRIK